MMELYFEMQFYKEIVGYILLIVLVLCCLIFSKK